MRILVAGAAGFIGSHVVARILDGALGRFDRLVLVDLHAAEVEHAHAEILTGSFADPSVRHLATAGGVDLVFHLASVPGGAAEADYARGRAVNLEGSLALIDAVADPRHPPRVVYTSSIAALGVPGTSYGAHKRMLELHVADRTRRGEIDGRSLRPSGIVARPAAAYAGFATAWMSDIFRQLARGHDFAVPTSADAALWLESVGAVADDIIHAARMPAEGLPPHRAWTLPATVATLRELTNTILAETGSRAAVAFAPSGMNQPALDNSDALAAGFCGDGSVTALVRAVLRQLDSKS